MLLGTLNKGADKRKESDSHVGGTMIHPADLYQTFFNTFDASIFVVDSAAKIIVEANARAINTTGFQPEELKGLAFDRLFRPTKGACVFWSLSMRRKNRLAMSCC